MPATARTMTEEDLRPAVEELFDQIVNGDDSDWQRFAARMAGEVAAGFKLGLFKVWSSNNRMYLQAQARRRPLGVHGMYAGVDQWRKRNRVVREGEEPFVIYGPPSFIVRNPNQAQLAAAQQPAAAQPPAAGATPPQQPVAPAPVVRGYRKPPIIEVFDYSQTVSTEEDFTEPDWAVPLAGGDLGTLDRLTGISPVPVHFKDLGSKVEHGWLDAAGITIDSSRTVAEQIFTLAHELGHFHLGHLDQIASTRTSRADEVKDIRARCEQEAALVQFFTMKMLGLDEAVGINVTAAAGQYLRTWTKQNPDGTTTEIAGHKGRRKLLKARMDAGFRAAQQIVTEYAQADAAPAAAA